MPLIIRALGNVPLIVTSLNEHAAFYVFSKGTRKKRQWADMLLVYSLGEYAASYELNVRAYRLLCVKLLDII